MGLVTTTLIFLTSLTTPGGYLVALAVPEESHSLSKSLVWLDEDFGLLLSNLEVHELHLAMFK